MAKKQKAKATETQTQEQPAPASNKQISLGALLSERPVSTRFHFWIVGDTPLISHAWSAKAKSEMLSKQAGATRSGKEKRDPETDFLESLYEMGIKDQNGDPLYGFPVTAIKKAILSCAHKDRGVPRSDVMAALWLDAEVVRTRPALAGAVCDMPLVRIYGDRPEMREDMVRIGAGLRKTANLAYRAQFRVWAIRVTGEINALMVAEHALAFLIRQSGRSIGIGDWRNEKSGVFGAYHLADVKEEEAWERFIAGKGPLPVPANYREAAE